MLQHLRHNLLSREEWKTLEKKAHLKDHCTDERIIFK
jgi:hypothetical protein